jgi:hypothetical protein
MSNDWHSPEELISTFDLYGPCKRATKSFERVCGCCERFSYNSERIERFKRMNRVTIRDCEVRTNEPFRNRVAILATSDKHI